jgi:hypothetical protein
MVLGVAEYASWCPWDWSFSYLCGRKRVDEKYFVCACFIWVRVCVGWDVFVLVSSGVLVCGVVCLPFTWTSSSLWMCVTMMTNSKTACFFLLFNRQAVTIVTQISASPRRFKTKFRNFNADVFMFSKKRLRKTVVCQLRHLTLQRVTDFCLYYRST